MFPCDDRTSIACARVMRGSSSMANAVTPACASGLDAECGRQQADEHAPAAQQWQLRRFGPRTLRMMSDWL